ncbi:hypothetical protein F5X98DRAFT_371930 [Xylaria grammica]|nr:hypothetical protein F5X98DRAFT_371930 [Xylaria grammica]
MESLTIKQKEPKKPDEFHLFRELPPELQRMIWEFWQDDQPAVYHYLFLASSHRHYVAVDSTRSRLVESTAQTADPNVDDGEPLSPFEWKITLNHRISTAVSSLAPESSVRIPWKRSPLAPWGFYGGIGDFRLEPRRSPVHTWMNFHKDVFFLGSNYGLPGQLRFFCDPIDAPVPRLNDNHWSRRIRQLAIYARAPDYRRRNDSNGRLSNLDRYVLTQLGGLRRVFIVVHFVPDTEKLGLPSISGTRFGLVPLHKIPDMKCGDWTSELVQIAEALRLELVDLFRQTRRSYIDVGLVIDTSEKFELAPRVEAPVEQGSVS